VGGGGQSLKMASPFSGVEWRSGMSEATRQKPIIKKNICTILAIFRFFLSHFYIFPY